jgi:hypothetical protein
MLQGRRRRRERVGWLTSVAVAALVAIGLACSPGGDETGTPQRFDRKASDPRAIEIAEATLEAMGGREAWDKARVLTWNYLGRRYYLWDRSSGDLRVESTYTGQDVVVAMNLDSDRGQAWIDGEPVSRATMLADMLRSARADWTNDSYWLIMPYKLQDPGVRLNYLGEREMLDGRKA